MEPAFLSGMLAGWATTQVALGAYFVLAYALGRRESEYVLFGLLCFSLAVTSAGDSWAYSGGRDVWHDATRLLHVGAIFAPVLNLHFAMRYARVVWPRWILFGAYALAVGFELAILMDTWWAEGSMREVSASVLSMQIRRFDQAPSAIGVVFYLAAATQLLVAVALLFWAHRTGKREALPALVGACVVAVATMNDVALALDLHASILLLPHVFWLYALPVAATLIVRYRDAAGELELTESYLRLKTEELRHSHAELQQVHDELARKQQLAAVGELAAAIAHEVRNPLAIIINAVAGLRRERLSEADRATLLDIIEEETGRLNRLVTDLLRFARPVSVVRSDVSLRDLAQKVQTLADERHAVVVDPHPGPDVRGIRADPGLLWLVLENVVSNAIQAMPEGGTTTVRTRLEDTSGGCRVSVEVSDTGHGMDERVLERAMDPFFTTRPSGTGLGLSIVQRIMEAHGGQVSLRSKPGEGTTVSLWLPVPSTPELQDSRRPIDSDR